MSAFLAKTPVWTKLFKSSSVTRDATQLHEVKVLVIIDDEGLISRGVRLLLQS